MHIILCFLKHKCAAFLQPFHYANLEICLVQQNYLK